MLSERIQKGLNIPSKNAKFNKLYDEDPYDESCNEKGYIRLCCADNCLSADLISARFRAIDWSKFDERTLLNYPCSGGEKSTLASAARFINRFSRKGLPPLSPNELVIVSGVTMASDMLSQILFDPGESLLTPAPFYYRFANDYGERGLVNLELVQTLAEHGNEPELLVERFEAAFSKAKSKVRAILLANPQNPDGCYFTLAQIRPIVEWALEKELFILLDEVYDLCIYEEQTGGPFQSAVQLFQTREHQIKLIWLWGMSKNFSIPGLRAAVVHTPNEAIRKALSTLVTFHQPNCLTQFVMRQFLDDFDWFEHVYLPENLRRLRQARDRLLAFLDSKGAVQYVKPKSGFYVLADLSKFMDEQTIEGERRLCERLVRAKVLLNPGEAIKAPKPGWFRIVFACVDAPTLEKSLQRMSEVLLIH